MLCAASLTLAALGPWTYAGFLAEPSRSPPPASSLAFPRIDLRRYEVAPPMTTRVVPKVTSRPEPPQQKKRESAPPVAPSLPVEAIRYRLADATGQVWEHSDPAWLQAFVVDRNQRMFEIGRRSSCVGSFCR